jgi:hypothetical protein
MDFRVLRAHDIPTVDRVAEGFFMHGRHIAVQQAGAVEFAEDAHDAAGAMDVLDVVFVGHRRHLAQAGHLTRNAVDVGHLEIDASLLRRSENVQHGVGRATHRHIEGHGVLEGLEGSDRTRQDRSIVLLVVAATQFDDSASGTQK